MSEPIAPGDSVAAIAARFPGSRRIFERHRIDHNAAGRLTLAAAAADCGLSSAHLISEILEDALRQSPRGPAWQAQPLDEILSRMASCYHAKLHNDLPEIQRLIAQAEAASGAGTPGLATLAQVCSELRVALEEHTGKEERLVFPLIRQLEQGRGKRPLPIATLEPVLASMEREHARIAETLVLVRDLVETYLVPQTSCAALQRLSHALRRTDRELVEHTRLEDEVIFPRARELERLALSAARR
jgi:regulator of cell morphogenesis and NO signaling